MSLQRVIWRAALPIRAVFDPRPGLFPKVGQPYCTVCGGKSHKDFTSCIWCGQPIKEVKYAPDISKPLAAVAKP